VEHKYVETKKKLVNQKNVYKDYEAEAKRLRELLGRSAVNQLTRHATPKWIMFCVLDLADTITRRWLRVLLDQEEKECPVWYIQKWGSRGEEVRPFDIGWQPQPNEMVRSREDAQQPMIDLCRPAFRILQEIAETKRAIEANDTLAILHGALAITERFRDIVYDLLITERIFAGLMREMHIDAVLSSSGRKRAKWITKVSDPHHLRSSAETLAVEEGISEAAARKRIYRSGIRSTRRKKN
jgi:hypothetical protein